MRKVCTEFGFFIVRLMRKQILAAGLIHLIEAGASSAHDDEAAMILSQTWRSATTQVTHDSLAADAVTVNGKNNLDLSYRQDNYILFYGKGTADG